MKILERVKRLKVVLRYVPTVIVFCCSLYMWIKGEVYYGLILTLIGLLMIANHFLSSQKGTGSKWSTPVWQVYLPIAAGLIIFVPLLYLQYKSGDETQVVETEVEVQRAVVAEASGPSVVSSGESSVSAASEQRMTDMMNRFLTPEQREDPTFQKVMKVATSDSFQKQMQEGNPQTLQEFADLLAAHGLTEFAEVDFDKIMADAYAFAMQEYQAANPGKDPEDEDEVMAKRIGEMLKTADPIFGIVEVMQDREISLWMSARFKGDQAALGKWLRKVMVVSESVDPASSLAPPADFDFPDGFLSDIPSDEPVERVPFVEPEPSLSDPIPTSVWEKFAVPNTENSSAVTPTVEPEKILTEVSPEPPAFPTEAELETALRERFSPERFERAMSTLERYGPEEGLRRLREEAPEIARQLEQRRDREDREADSRSKGR